MTNNVSDFLNFAIESVHSMGKYSLSFYGKGSVSTKFDENLITEAELKVMQEFEILLENSYPGHKIFDHSEPPAEYTHDSSRYTWVIDPLDGLANFQAGIPVWGISLALLDNYWPVLGVFYMPASNDIFYATANGTAFWNDRELAPSNITKVDNESVLLTTSRFHKIFKSNFPGKIMAMGCSGAHLCYTACGRGDGVITAKESYKGLAAVCVIAQSAGIQIFRMDGKPFSYGEYLEGRDFNEPLLMASPRISNKIRQCIEFLSV